MFPWQRYIPASTHGVNSHFSVAKQQQFILCMVLYIAYSDAIQVIACMCQISLVYFSLRIRYESNLSYFLTDPRSMEWERKVTHYVRGVSYRQRDLKQNVNISTFTWKLLQIRLRTQISSLKIQLLIKRLSL